ncbi:3-carboxy-cis,cis-mucoante lactonizing enzyme [Eremomyces bilateralis CBS 781.70]|uniref:3-carboxy-cis,cis-mucoante lactonizing enzyme n=1 Tax=Eremomyces bilateralis CBS 781.70 TaxID=1392243 RepID=A0A6G1FYS8_9PEZI|nr:3-carboxy-cis,cis-mucoante lactonizing enzyme [Eremomyces bilateralis CBS 781.70]KAF1810928.1 3-carboxy-cis,cis-mucoante lactonizing enzyme [Eremomyces bilateralis CBS 781.70]
MHIFKFSAFVFTLLPALSSCANLFVSSYLGNVTTIALPDPLEGDISNHTSFVNNGCGLNPSWLTWNALNRTLFCLDEGWTTGNGSLVSFLALDTGRLVRVKGRTIGAGPVSAVLGGPADSRAVVIADYAGGAVESFTTGALGLTTKGTYIQLSLPSPDPRGGKQDPERQSAPHPHQAILDPTGEFIVVPDLGSDQLRVFRLGANALLEETVVGINEPENTAPAVDMRPGLGPRHAAFVTFDDPYPLTLLYVVGELSNTMTMYNVYYEEGIMVFIHWGEQPIFGLYPAPGGASVGEILISPDKKNIFVSNRNDQLFKRRDGDGSPVDSFETFSDSITTFSLNSVGDAVWKGLSPSGGVSPRHMAFNKDGTILAVANQKSGRVMFWNRNLETGDLVQVIAWASVPGELSSVVWDE